MELSDHFLFCLLLRLSLLILFFLHFSLIVNIYIHKLHLKALIALNMQIMPKNKWRAFLAKKTPYIKTMCFYKAERLISKEYTHLYRWMQLFLMLLWRISDLESVMRVRFFNVVFSFVVLLIEEIAEIFCWKGNDIGWIFLDDCFWVMFENVGQLFRDNDLFCRVYSLLSDVCHYETYWL